MAPDHRAGAAACGTVTANTNRWLSGLLMLLNCAGAATPAGSWNSVRGGDGSDPVMSTVIIICPGGCDRKKSCLPSLRQAMPPSAFACETFFAADDEAEPIADASKGRTNV